MIDSLPPIPEPAHRFGVLVPPANPTVEIEYQALAPANVVFHSMRLPVIAGDLDARNRGYVGAYSEALRGFGSLRLEGISVAMTGPQYRLLYQGDVDLCSKLSDLAGVPVETSSIALCNALRAMGKDHISLLSPYPDWLTHIAQAYWESAGFRVDHVRSFEDRLVAYEATPSRVAEVLRDTKAEAEGAIVMSGTGMRSLEALVLVRSGVPVISSNLCGVWSLTRNLQVTDSPWMRACLPSALIRAVSVSD